MVAVSQTGDKKKQVKVSYTVDQKQWVGDGFHVHGLLRPTPDLGPYISPFILMDYAAPKEFSQTNQRRGVGEHPHRGFETVTLAYQGEVEHQDSSGGGGTIQAGDVQWMTAGQGVVHSEFHSENFAKAGGIFEMVQLWVNLPKKHKMTKPKYQSITKKDIPVVKTGDHSAIRIIAGELQETKGPASTFSPINMYDMRSEQEDEVSLSLNSGTNTIVLVMDGELEIDGTTFGEKSIVIFDQEGESIHMKTSEGFKGLILNGEPINEPLVAHGPFVMNTKEEIFEAIQDFQSGKMGRL